MTYANNCFRSDNGVKQPMGKERPNVGIRSLSEAWRWRALSAGNHFLIEGWMKMNVAGSFVAPTGEAGVGIVIRNHVGEVQLTAWRVLFRCASADEAEAQACAEGLRIASQWCSGPMIIESDCSLRYSRHWSLESWTGRKLGSSCWRQRSPCKLWWIGSSAFS